MVKDELNNIRDQFEKDVELYKKIITDALKHRLIPSLKENEPDILNEIRMLTYKGKKSIKIRFVSWKDRKAALYKMENMLVDDYYVFSIKDCIENFLYQYIWRWRRQVQYKHVDIDALYERLRMRAGYSLMEELAILPDIIEQHPQITQSVVKYFDGLGLNCKVQKDNDTIAMTISF